MNVDIEILREEGNLDVVQKRIDDSYKFKLDKDGNVVGENKFEDLHIPTKRKKGKNGNK